MTKLIKSIKWQKSSPGISGKSRHNDELKWWRLDNAALIYPSSVSETWPAVFRISAHLHEMADPEILQIAVNDIMPRLPFYNVQLKRGFFWFYLEEQPFPPKVKEESDYPCRKFDINSKKHLIRILYYKNKITFECFHSLSDGRGALKFLTALLTRYFELKGIKIYGKEDFINYLDKPQPGEAEDAFARYADLKETSSRKSPVAFSLPGTPLPYGKLHLYTAVIELNEIKSVAKQKGATLTEYMIAMLMLASNDQRKIVRAFKKPVTVQVPIDLRPYFPSETMRNFSSFKFIVMPESEDFDEIIKSVREQLEQINKDYLMRNINANVKAAKYSRFVPLPIKSVGLRFSSRLFGERLSTVTISNLGIVKTPPEMTGHIQFIEVVLGRSRYNNICTGCASYNGKLVWTFSSKIEETGMLTNLFKRISDDGIKIDLISNREG